MIARFLPLLGMFIFFAVGFFGRALLHYLRHGKLGIILFHSTRWSQRLRDVMFVLLLSAVSAQAVVAAVWPELLANLFVIAPPHDGLGLFAGGLLLLGGTVLMVSAQLNLGASWRIGIEEKASPGLITGGLYSVCRNPIFLGMFVILAGLGALLPSWISAAVFLGSIVCVRSQVLEEEAYLSNTYRDAYRTYAGRVGRFVPVLGRLVE